MIITTKNAFLIQGKDYSYAMYINKAGFLQHLYFGSKVSDSDIDYLIKKGDCLAPNSDDINFDMAFDAMPQEYGCFARGDFKEPSVIATRKDGDSMMRLRYVGHKISQGAPSLKDMPHARFADETLEITLKDDFSDIEITLIYVVNSKLNILVRNSIIRNTGDSPIQIKKAFSFCIDLPAHKYSVLRLAGRMQQERTPQISQLAHGITRLQSLRGISSHQTNPFMALLKDGCNENCGECYGTMLCYSGSFALSAEYADHIPTRIQGGINDTSFSWILESGEAFTTPQAFLSYSNNGLGQLSRNFADFLRAAVICPKRVNKSRPILVNNWEGTYFDFDNNKLMAIIDEAKELDIDTFVLDDGWFGKRNDDHSSLGDWVVNESKLIGGLKTVIDHCKEQGIKFGLWFEPEMISEDSELFRAHPDYAIAKKGVEPCRSRYQLVLDLTRQEVVDYAVAAVSKILIENDISYVKWDMNRSITECYSEHLPADRQGEFIYRFTLGVYSLAERLMSAFPEVFFEGCASGGGRFDAGMLYYFPQIWTSDCTDAFERTKIQWGTSIAYPLSSMSCHISAVPNHQTHRTASFATRGAVASLGATGYELDLCNLTDKEKEQVRAQIASYKQIEHLILSGDLYRLSSPFESNYFCEMVVSKDKAEAYLVGERIHAVPYDYPQYIKLLGLDETKQYTIRELDITATGKALASAGVRLPALGDFEAWTWHLHTEEQAGENDNA